MGEGEDEDNDEQRIDGRHARLEEKYPPMQNEDEEEGLNDPEGSITNPIIIPDGHQQDFQLEEDEDELNLQR